MSLDPSPTFLSITRATVHSGQRLMGPVVKREISQKILRILTVMSRGDLGRESADSETAERYCREAEERWTARAGRCSRFSR
jgi:hypothetical protein